MSERVPEGWKKIDLEDGVSALVSGQSPNRKENAAKGTAFGILKTTAINWGRFDEQQNQEVLDEYEPNKKHLVLENDILITKAGPAHRVGVVAQAKNIRSNVLLSGKMTAIRVNDKFFPDFLSYALCQEEAQNHLQANTTGMASSQTNFTHDSLLRVPVLTPPLPEQKKIASILTSVDEVIETTQKKIDKLQDLKKATRNELLTRGIGHTEFKDSELGRIPKSWEGKCVDDLIKFTGGAQPPRSSFVFEPKPGYVRLLQIRDYKSDRFATYIPEELSRRSCSEKDVLIGRYGPPIFQILRGKSGSYNVALIKAEPRCENLLKGYMFHFLTRSDLFHMIDSLSQRTSGQTGIDLEALKSFGFPLPTIEEQHKIIAMLDHMDDSIKSLSSKLSQTQSLKKSLMQDLLTGKVRVKVN